MRGGDYIFNEFIIDEQIIADGIGEGAPHFEVRLQYIKGKYRFTYFSLEGEDKQLDFDDKETAISYIENTYNLSFWVRFDHDEELSEYLA